MNYNKNVSFKKIGILGGAGPESTFLLYRLIISRFQELGAKNHNDFPFMVILNVPIPDDVDKLHDKALMKKNIQEASYMLGKYTDFIAIPCNTLHIFYEDIKKWSGVPVVHMIDEVKRIIREKKYTKLLLFGKTPLVQSGLYESDAYQIILPNKKEQEMVNSIIRNLLIHNIREDDSKKLDNITSRYEVDAVIFGCSELPLLEINIRPVVRSTYILADAVVDMSRVER